MTLWRGRWQNFIALLREKLNFANLRPHLLVGYFWAALLNSKDWEEIFRRKKLMCNHVNNTVAFNFTTRKRSCGKVMFLHLSVSHSVHRGVCMMSLLVWLLDPMFLLGREFSVSGPMFLPGEGLSLVPCSFWGSLSWFHVPSWGVSLTKPPWSSSYVPSGGGAVCLTETPWTEIPMYSKEQGLHILLECILVGQMLFFSGRDCIFTTGQFLTFGHVIKKLFHSQKCNFCHWKNITFVTENITIVMVFDLVLKPWLEHKYR